MTSIETHTTPPCEACLGTADRHQELLAEEAATLASPRRRAGLVARSQFRTMDLLDRRVVQARDQQDNEQWHLFILEDMLEHRGARFGHIRHRWLPQLLAFGYYQVSWLMFVLRPERSYRLNADFEDHAEHEYMAFVAEHPELEAEACACSVASDYGCFGSFADVLRSIGVDERHHKLESLDDLERLALERAARTT